MQMRYNLVPGVWTIYKGLTTVMGMEMGVVERGIFKSLEKGIGVLLLLLIGNKWKLGF